MIEMKSKKYSINLKIINLLSKQPMKIHCLSLNLAFSDFTNSEQTAIVKTFYGQWKRPVCLKVAFNCLKQGNLLQGKGSESLKTALENRGKTA